MINRKNFLYKTTLLLSLYPKKFAVKARKNNLEDKEIIRVWNEKNNPRYKNSLWETLADAFYLHIIDNEYFKGDYDVNEGFTEISMEVFKRWINKENIKKILR